MPKENMHIDFALQTVEYLPECQREIIRKGELIYLLGAVFPDMFYYTGLAFSADLHRGSEGKSPKEFLLLAFGDEELRPFAYGYLTHFVLDATLHKSINAYSKDSPVYLHRYLETCLDKRLSSGYHLGVFYTPKNILTVVKALKKLSKLYKRELYPIKTTAVFLLAHYLMRKKWALFATKILGVSRDITALSYEFVRCDDLEELLVEFEVEIAIARESAVGILSAPEVNIPDLVPEG